MKADTQTTKRERIILALLEHGSHDKAAAALGIAPSTIWRWLQKPSFQAEYRKAKQESYSRCMGRLQYGASAAVSTLMRIMIDKTAAAAARVQAAERVLQHAANSFAMENLQTRIENLEQKKKGPVQ